MSPERGETCANWKTGEIIMPEAFVEQFLELPLNRGSKLYRIEFNKESTKTLENGTSKTTKYPVLISPTGWIDKKSRRFTRESVAGIHEYYLLSRRDHSYLIEFHFFSHIDSDVYFAGITKVPNLNSVRNKEKWQTVALHSRIRPNHFMDPNQYNPTPSIGITFTGGRYVNLEVAGDEKDPTIESFYQKLTRNITT